MDLFYREFGERGRPTLVILHGLLGSSRNWQVMARDLAEHFHVLLPDLRNHGQSPHLAGSSYKLQAGDVLALLEARGIDRAHIVGHSMGGKVAMRLACDTAELVERLTIVDIAPKGYPTDAPELDAMQRLDPTSVSTRREAVAAMEPDLPDESTRLFLVMNLERDDHGKFRWGCNLAELSANIADLRVSPLRPDERFSGPTQFILGGMSDFVEPEDHPTIRAHFPGAKIHTIAESGHNPHAETHETFRDLVLSFA